MLSSAAHSKASLMAAQLPAVAPQLYAQTVVDPSLIRTVDLGPFKHKIDDGLELRKAAFECMDVLLDACADRLDYHAFLKHLESGLKACSCSGMRFTQCCLLCRARAIIDIELLIEWQAKLAAKFRCCCKWCWSETSLWRDQQ